MAAIIFDFVVGLIKSLAKLIGWGGVVAIGVVIYFTGLPIINKIPYISYVPLAGELAVGRMQTYADEQVKLATSAMVSKAELDAQTAIADRERELRLAADQVSSNAQKRADDLQAAVNSQSQQIKDLTESAKGLPTWTDQEIQWFKQHSR